ncbi:CBS domain-containing protein [Actinokineospora sp. NBRC 105648]|uniref:magnesium transporter MgtE N-terminal domain-containing protein n=1 Tax=Actinokineospora sp. NBRC 105648 TaxID=3032206 RepID=UPI0024A214B8|nr:CBS domain-containing protein [Actinokineospora sp. NBRC 105648]GLZ43225.1 magnesium transporter [Actinokineospora sp. NBRC 105648]
MAGMSKIFVAQLLGLPVFGPDGESIGRIRDLVAGLRADGAPPRVLGIVIELATRRRIFVPMLRVAGIDSNAITLATGSVNLRHFHQRPNEVLVVGQLLDARVEVTASGASAVVVDTAMEPTRTRDWVLGRLAIRERTGRLGRRGPVQVLNWSDIRAPGITELTGQPQGAHQLLAVFDTMRAADVATALQDLPLKRRYEVADALDDERLADVIEELPEDDQKDLLAHLDEERAADVLEAMDPDDAADLLAELSDVDKNRLLELMEPEESAPVRRLLEFASDTAGGLMTPEPIVLTPDAPIAEALARVRNPDLTPALASMVFVCRPPSATPTGRYLGCVHIQRLLREPPFDLVAGAVDRELARLRPTDSLVEITRYFATYNLVCAPVVDDEDHLLGAVTVDDVLDHLLPDGWRERESALVEEGERA